MVQKNDSNIDNSQVKKDKKISFIKKFLISIKGFDKYYIFTKESVGRALLYLAELMLIFSIITAGVSLYKFSLKLNDVVSYFNDNIENLSYNNGLLTVDDNKKEVTNEFSDELGTIIIDTSDLNDQQIADYQSGLDKDKNGIIFLKDKMLLKDPTISSVSEMSYSELLKSSNVTSTNKQDILNYYNNNKMAIYNSMVSVIFIYTFISYMISTLLDALLLAVLCILTAKISKVDINFNQSISMSIHALTLPLILSTIYIVVNTLTGYTIKYFQVMYTAISCIYILTAVLMMRSDYIKKQMELQKIESEQDKVKEELAQKKLEEKRQEEKDKVKDKDRKEEGKSSKGNDTKPQVGDKPEGSNV